MTKTYDMEHGDLFGYRPKRRGRAEPKKRTDPFRKPPLPPTKMPRLEAFVPIKCPCCQSEVTVPKLEIVIDHYRIPPSEARILEVVWHGNGRPVSTERIFAAMYADDPDGGPEPRQMYAALKAALHNIRCRLIESGITIESVGYRMGFRLVIGEK